MIKYKNLMLIDDDDDDQEIFILALQSISDDIKCIQYTDASKALKALVAEEVKPERIFLDLNMPVMNGHQFLDQIKRNENTKHIPVVIFSTSSQPSTIRATKELGAEDFITKPGDFETLITILKNHLSK
jgi:CheY-like chemotaxis protein